MNYTTRYKAIPQMVDNTRAVVQACPHLPGVGDGVPLWTGDYCILNHPTNEGQLRLRINMPSMQRVEPGASFTKMQSNDAARIAGAISATAASDYPYIGLVTDVVVSAPTVPFPFKAHVQDLVDVIKKNIPTMVTIDLEAIHD